MSQTKIYRCWYADGSARLVNQVGHQEAAEEAVELAGLQNGDMPRRGHEDRQRYLDACRIVKTECLTDGTSMKWKMRQVPKR